MNHGAVRKLTRAATLSLLVLTTTTGMAGWEVLAASPAMAQPSSSPADEGGGSSPGSGTPAAPDNPVAGIIGLVGGGAPSVP